MRLDHCGEYIPHGQGGLAIASIYAAQIIRDGQNSTKIIRGVAPFCCQPGVIKIKPANERADIPCSLYRIHFVRGAGHACSVPDVGARHQWAEVLGGLWEAQGQQAAAQSINKAVSGSIVGLVRTDIHVCNIFRNVDKDLVRGRTNIHLYVSTHVYLFLCKCLVL